MDHVIHDYTNEERALEDKRDALKKSLAAMITTIDATSKQFEFKLSTLSESPGYQAIADSIRSSILAQLNEQETTQGRINVILRDLEETIGTSVSIMQRFNAAGMQITPAQPAVTRPISNYTTSRGATNVNVTVNEANKNTGTGVVDVIKTGTRSGWFR